MKKATGYRQEHDSIGERAVPEQAYYGIQTLRAVENFCITRQRTHPALIESMVQVKKAAALANLAAGELDEKRAKAIAAACDEILGGALHDEFIVDPVQGGAGTSLNMNANEVIANRAIELLGGEKGNYALVSPNVQFEAEATVPAAVEQDVRIMDNVLRFLCVRKDEA